MKNMLKKTAIAGALIALTAIPAAAQVGVYLGPFGAGVGVYHRHHYYDRHYYDRHRVCRVDYYGYEHCYWR